MKTYIITLLILSSFISCQKEDYTPFETKSKVEDKTTQTPDVKICNTTSSIPLTSGDKMDIHFYDPIRSESATYETVRIGEYLWTTSNINHYPTNTILKNRDQIDLAITRYRMDVDEYNVSTENINKYFGPYYTYSEYEQIEGNRNRYEITEANDQLAPKGAWGTPSNADVSQLFAMCGNGSEQDVRTCLTAKVGDNPAVIFNYTYWFSGLNKNKYGINLMPGGARFNDKQIWKLEHNHNLTDSEIFNIVPGDFYGFLQSTVIKTWDGRVTIDDYIKIDTNKSWHWTAIRWCRKLTDEELGYKLYVNSNQTDIKMLDITEKSPTGYTELKNGAFRGFYIQNIIEGANPSMSISEMKELARKLS